MVELLNHIARLWWDWTASMFWQVGLLILLIGCVDLLIRKWAWPQLRYALWSLIVVKLLLPPTLSLPSGIVPELRPKVAHALAWLNAEKRAGDKPAPLSDCGLQIADSMLGVSSQFEHFELSTGSSVAVEGLVCGVPVRVSTTRVEGVPPSNRGQDARDTTPAGVTTNALAAVPPSGAPVNPQSAMLSPRTPVRGQNPQLEWRFYAMTLWLSGTLILGIWLFLRLHSVAGRHAYRAAATSLPQSFYNHLAGCAARLGLRRIPRVAVTRRLTSPAVFGVMSPVLLMPKGYLSKLSRRDTEHMLLHELAHIKRGDLVMHSLYMLLQIVYWYNPLLWLVRQQVHHLRELSCDGTVAELLRERTGAYRQTLLETARRLLATSAEPGLGLLGLFEDSNRLLVRLNWLTKPTWRYKTMKRVIVATIAALMFVCVLPMAQALEAASKERSLTVTTEEDQPSQEQLSQDIASLQARLERLKAQERQLQEQLRALSEQSERVRPSREGVRESRQRSAVRPRGESTARAPAESRTGPGGGRPQEEGMSSRREGVPPEARSGRGAGRVRPERMSDAPEQMPPEAREQLRHAQEQVKHVQEQARQAMTHARNAQDAANAQAETEQAKAQEKAQWETQIEAWGQRLEGWEQSDAMKKWQLDMEQWGEQMGRWGQDLARRQKRAAQGTESSEVAPVPPMPAMPAMPAMPPMPPVPAEENLEVNMHVQVEPHVRGGGAPGAGTDELRVPHIAPPRITPPMPPLPPALPEKRADEEEAVSRTEHTIDLAPGQLLEVKNEMGTLTVRGSDEPGCRLVVTVKGRAATMEEAEAIVDQVEPVIKASQDGVSVSTTKPQDEDNKDRVHRVVLMELVVPRDAHLRLAQNFGDIRLTDLDGSVRAVSNMGSIRTSNVRGRVNLESNMGAIDFLAPRDFSAKVQAKSQMGSIQSDLPLEVIKPEGFSMGSKLSGTIGDGDGDVSLTTNMGSIRIRSESSEPARTRRSRAEPRSEPRPEPRPAPREVF